MISEIIFLIIALVVLNKTSYWLVNSSIFFAKITRIGNLAIGFLLVAFTTSIPELTVSLAAINMEQAGIAIGNLFGSNIANLCLIVGLPALFYGISIKNKTFKELTRYLLLCSVIPFPLIFFKEGNILFGILCISFFIYFFYTLLKKRSIQKTNSPIPLKKLPRALLFFVIGLLGVLISSNIIVKNASAIAEELNLLPSVIGATVIAVGTSLPELAVSLKAVQKKQYDLAVGNAVGSCVINISLILGLVFVFANFAINMEAFATLVYFSIFANVAFLIFAESESYVSRLEGVFLILLYLFYLVLIIT